MMSISQPIDWNKILLLVDASVQAYRAWDRDPGPPVAPQGWVIVDTWTGVDSIFGKKRTVETYGIVFRSVEAPYRYMFSFRGTDSLLDLIEDLGVERKHFTAIDAAVEVPPDVEIESGFADVYTESNEDTSAMRQQVFDLLDRYVASTEHPLHELWITGHSLGAALGTLFCLDVALSRPGIVASSINFACPRVGNSSFVAFYQQQVAQQNPAFRTLRVQNIYDRIPDMPPEAMGYQHLENVLFIAFHKFERIPIDLGLIVHNHAVVNYQAVLQCAALSTIGYCNQASLAVPGKSYAITSVRPKAEDLVQAFQRV